MENSMDCSSNGITQEEDTKKKVKRHFDSIHSFIFLALCIVLLEILRHLGVRITNLTGIFALPVVYVTMKKGIKIGILTGIIGTLYTFHYLFLSGICRHSNSFKISYFLLNCIILYIFPILVGRLNKKLKATNIELLKKQEQLARVEEFSIVMVTYSDLEGNLTKVPENYCKFLGYPEEELLRMKFQDITHPDDLQIELAKIHDIIVGKYKSFEMEKRYLKKDGEYVWVYINSSLIIDEYGEPFAFLAYVKDIDNYKKTSLELLESEKKLRTITDNMIDMICQTDQVGNFVYISPSHKKVLGYDPEDLLDFPVFDIIHPEDRERVKVAFDKTLLLAGPGKIELRGQHKEGHYIWLEVLGNVLYDENNNIVGTIFSSRDITPRKIAEEALLESEKRYRQLVELLPYAIFVHRENILFANKAAAQLLGYETIDKLIGEPVMKFIHKDYLEQDLGRMKEVYEGKRVPLFEEKIIRRNGQILDVETTGILFEYEGEPAIQMIAKDISDRKRAVHLEYDILKQQEELNKAMEYDKLKTEFFANISHELRTPLNVILGTLQLLKYYFNDEYIKNKNPNINKHTYVMKQNCYRLLRLVNNLIDATKIDSGFYELQLHQYDVIDIIRKITDSVAAYIESKDIKLEFRTGIQKQMMAVDPDKIERIMLNLLSNAVKFTPAGGKIMVKTIVRKETLRISVSDTGVGIPENKVDQLFKRFHQLDKSLARKHEGSGIGLSLVHSLVNMHGGDIFINTKYKRGCQLIIDLPIINVDLHLEQLEEDHIESSSRIERIHLEFSDIYTS